LKGTGPVDKIAGGWSVGTIMTYRSGAPARLTGGYSTFNNIGDGGIVLNGVTRDELQNAVGVYKTGANYVTMIDPKFRTVNVGANTNFITANATPGTFAGTTWIYGPGGFECDLSLTKDTAVTERSRIQFQAQFLNAFNHPIFRGSAGGSVRGSGWATTTGASNNSRVIEFRLRFSF